MHSEEYKSMGNAIQEILGKNWDELVKESDTVT